MSGHKDERILVQIDAEPQKFTYQPDKFLINRFGYYKYINTVPLNLLLAQKIFACLNRKREKGRDFFDVVFLMSKTTPDYAYLKAKVGLSGKDEVIQALRTRAKNVDLEALANDVEPFLMDPAQKARVTGFEQWLDTMS